MFEVPGLSAATMQLIIDFAYTGSVSVTEDNVRELLQAADQFIITGIEQACSNFLLERLSSENCIGIWQLCNICLCPELQEKAYRYLLIHFEEVVFREEFQQLSVQELSGILDSDELNVRQESTLCDTIFKWVDYEPAERRQHLTVLLSKVRLALTSQSFLSQLMNTEAVSSNAECMKIVQQAKKLKIYMSMLSPSTSVCSEKAARPRLPNSILFTIGSDFEMNYPKIVTEAYDFHADRWKIVSNPDCGVYTYLCHGIVHLNGSVYCVGCCHDKSAVYRLDLTNHTCLLVEKMHRHRCYASVTVLGGLIYVLGGIHFNSSPSATRVFTLKSAERYNPQTNKWRLVSSMHEERSQASCTTLHNKIYICGGYNGKHPMDTCECYCPETNRWTSFTSMSKRRCGLGVIAYENLIFAVGGMSFYTPLKSVEAYDPRTDTWKKVSSMLTRRAHLGIAVIDHKLFAVGGSDLTDRSVECYDKSTNLWSEVCQMETRFCHPSCCVVSGLPNVAEYVISRDNLRLNEAVGLVESRHSV